MLATALYSPWLPFKPGLYEPGGNEGEEDMRVEKEEEGERKKDEHVGVYREQKRGRKIEGGKLVVENNTCSDLWLFVT